MRRYSLAIEVTDPTLGWNLGARVLPHRYLIRVDKFGLYSDKTGRLERELTDDELRAWYQAEDEFAFHESIDGLIGVIHWLVLEVESSPTQPPRCVALRAPGGIATPEQRFPLAGVLAHASALAASRDGTFRDPPQGVEYDDALFETNRARRRRRTRSPITDERLEEVARVAREHPRAPTAAVRHHLRISRGYARRLIKLAEAAGLETR